MPLRALPILPVSNRFSKHPPTHPSKKAMSDGYVAVNAFLLLLLAIIAVVALRVHRLFALVILSGAFSLTAAAQFVVLDAVDVAFTEAA